MRDCVFDCAELSLCLDKDVRPGAAALDGAAESPTASGDWEMKADMAPTWGGGISPGLGEQRWGCHHSDSF